MSVCDGDVVDLRPARAVLLGVQGDPVGFRLNIRDDDGDYVDVSGWEWAGRCTLGRGAYLDFEFYPDPGGVSVVMRGDDTARIPVRGDFPFDIAARQPTAGEGGMVLSGRVSMERRQTPPLRSDPDAIPAEEPVPV